MDRMMKALSTTAGMWRAVLIACASGLLLIGVTSRSGVLASRAIWATPMVSWEHWILMALVVSGATCLTAAPCIRFLAAGWHCRLDEFRNRIRDGAVRSYLTQFWNRQLAERVAAGSDNREAERLFA